MTTFTIETKSNGTVTAEFAVNSVSELNNKTRGDSASFEIELSEADFGTLRNYDEFGGKYTTFETLDSTIPYREFIQTKTISSLVVGIEPEQSLKDRDVTGIWGIIDTVTDSRNNALSINRINLDVTILAPYTDYADHTAIETALKI